jgi:hypothetical protein
MKLGEARKEIERLRSVLKEVQVACHYNKKLYPKEPPVPRFAMNARVVLKLIDPEVGPLTTLP